MERELPRPGARGCATLGVGLLVLLGLVLVALGVGLETGLLGSRGGTTAIGWQLLAVFDLALLVATAVALLTAASPRGVAARWVRRSALVVGLLGAAVAAWLVTSISAG